MYNVYEVFRVTDSLCLELLTAKHACDACVRSLLVMRTFDLPVLSPAPPCSANPQLAPGLDCCAMCASESDVAILCEACQCGEFGRGDTVRAGAQALPSLSLNGHVFGTEVRAATAELLQHPFSCNPQQAVCVLYLGTPDAPPAPLPPPRSHLLLRRAPDRRL